MGRDMKRLGVKGEEGLMMMGMIEVLELFRLLQEGVK
jgi:hypothetical protein